MYFRLKTDISSEGVEGGGREEQGMEVKLCIWLLGKRQIQVIII